MWEIDYDHDLWESGAEIGHIANKIHSKDGRYDDRYCLVFLHDPHNDDSATYEDQVYRLSLWLDYLAPGGVIPKPPMEMFSQSYSEALWRDQEMQKRFDAERGKSE